MKELYERNIYISLNGGEEWLDISRLPDFIILDTKQARTSVVRYNYQELLEEVKRNKYKRLECCRSWFSKKEYMRIFTGYDFYKVKYSPKLDIMLKEEYHLSYASIKEIAYNMPASQFIEYLKLKDIDIKNIQY